MKKQLVVASLAMLGIFTNSCGGKNENKTETETEKKIEKVADCPCNSLMDESGSLKNKNFTGICADKDQNDTIILNREYKNGYLLSELIKEKFNNSYFITKNMTYDNNKELNGYQIASKKVFGTENKFYSRSYKLFKNGIIQDYYDISIDFDKYSEEDNKWSILAKWNVKNGNNTNFIDKSGEVNQASRPNFMSEAEPVDYGNSSGTWKLEKLDEATFNKILNNIEKEFPHFFLVK